MAKLLKEYAEKGNSITEENLDKIVGGNFNKSTAYNKSNKYTDRALIDFLAKALPLGAVSGTAGVILADNSLIDGPEMKSVLIGTSIATGVLALKSILSGMKNAHNSCWWNYIAENAN